MRLDLEHINILPVRTWSWLGVNELSIQEAIPDIRPYGKEPLLSRPQSKISVIANNDSAINDSQINDSQINGSITSMETGMGADTVEFISKNRNSGFSITVPSGVRMEEPIYIQYEMDGENPTVVDFNRIIAEDNSEVTIVMNYCSKEGVPVFHGGLTYLYAGENAVIHLIQVQLLNDESIHLNDIGAIVEKDGKIDIVQAELGASKAINGCKTCLKGNNSKMDLNTIYFGDKKRFIDINYVVNHIGKYSQSEIMINGALMDESIKIFRGTIDFKKGAVGAVGHENEYNLLFSPKIKNITAPLILCGEENVEGKHAANSGKIDDNKLFYIMSRGLDELSAKKLIIEASFQPVLDKIPDTNLKNHISDYVKERLTHIESI